MCYRVLWAQAFEKKKIAFENKYFECQLGELKKLIIIYSRYGSSTNRVCVAWTQKNGKSIWILWGNITHVVAIEEEELFKFHEPYDVVEDLSINWDTMI
jgi:hypothetical protein